jgi:hypothetical protein
MHIPTQKMCARICMVFSRARTALENNLLDKNRQTDRQTDKELLEISRKDTSIMPGFSLPAKHDEATCHAMHTNQYFPHMHALKSKPTARMYIYIYIYIYIHTHTLTHNHTHTHIHTRTHPYTYTHTYTYRA